MQRYGIECDFRRSGELTVPRRRTRWSGWRRSPAARSSTATRCAPTWTRPPTSPGCTSPTTWRWSTLPGSRGGWRRPRSPSACGSPRACGSRGCDVRAPASRSPRATARSSRRPSCSGHQRLPTLVRRTRLHTVPVYDYALMTEPLTDAQLDSLGWASRAGVGDMANQFHYYRLSADNRILWGGYDAIYHYGRASGRAWTSGRRRSTGWPATSSRRSPSSRGCGSATAGVGPSTPAPGSVPSTARRIVDGSRMPWASPGSVWGPPASARR